MTQIDKDISLTGGPPEELNTNQKVGVFIGLFGLGIIILAAFNGGFADRGLWLTISLLSIFSGVMLFSKGAYGQKKRRY